MNRAVLILLLILLPAAARGEGPIELLDVTAQSGITFRHTDGATGKRYIIEYVASGLALLDYDSDGDEDLYLLNGAPQPPGGGNDPQPRNALYRNEGEWQFVDVTDQAGVGDTGHGLGVAAADVDNDGDVDLYVNNAGPNVLYVNNGDGTFSDRSNEANVTAGDSVGAGCCFLDIEADGDLDLYVANYVQFSYEEHRPHTLLGVPAYPSPLEYTGQPDVLYENRGDGTFADISRQAGIAALAGTGMGAVCGDFDRDGDTDIYVGNDVMPNYLWQNDGRGRFQEMGLQSGVAYDFRGVPQGSMGADAADFDQDGQFDLAVTSYGNEMTAIYQNLGSNLWIDVAREVGVGKVTWPLVTWGLGWVDFDNDSFTDLFIACGDLDDNVQQRNDAARYRLPNLLLRNNGKGQFVDVSAHSGSGLQVEQSSRGAAFDDLDGDGRIDGVVLNARSAPTLMRNMSPPQHWLELELTGVSANRQGVGTVVRVTVGDRQWIEEVRSGRSYQSHFGTRLHFGLGPHTAVQRVEVHWLPGQIEVWENLPADRRIRLRQGGSPRWGGGVESAPKSRSCL